MGFRDETVNAAIFGSMAAPNGCDLAGVLSSSSQKPLGNIRDLRHPNPVRPFSPIRPFIHACSYPHGSTFGRSIGRTAEFWPRLSWRKPCRLVAVSDQRIVVVEDRTDG